MKKQSNLILAVLLCVTSTSWATVTIFDSNTTVADGQTYDEVVIKGNGTTVEMTGGTISALVTMDSAIFNMTGGTVGRIYAHDDSQLNLSGGLIGGEDKFLLFCGNSIVTFSGSIVCDAELESIDNSTLHVSDSAQLDYTDVDGNSVAYIDGGFIYSLEVESTAIISGGTFTKSMLVYAGSNVIIVGNDITKRPYSSTSVLFGEVTGYWESGPFFSISLSQRSYGRIKTQPPSVALCMSPPSNDLNDDCIVNFLDFSKVASEWLGCGLDPIEACLE